MRFSERANSIRPTGVRRMFDMAGDDAVQFGLGEPDFQPPDLAIDAFEKAMRDCLLYTSPSPRDQRGSRMPSSA